MPDTATLPASHDLNDLAALVDNRLDADARARVEAHIAGCLECRRTLAVFARAQHVSRNEVGFGVARWSTPRTVRLLALAASVLLATTVAAILLRPTADPSVGRTINARDIVLTATPPAAVPSPAARSATPPPGPPPSALRNGEKIIGGKRFRLEAGEWVDSAYDPTEGLPVTAIDSETVRAALLRQHPGLAEYTALGPRVTVVFRGAVYKFDVR